MHITIITIFTTIDHFELVHTDYLMSAANSHKHATAFECVDSNPQYMPGLSTEEDGGLLYYSKPACSSTNRIGYCPPYDDDKQLTCVVCSK